MRKQKGLVVAVAAVIAMLITAASPVFAGGPVVIGGDDLDLHGSWNSTNGNMQGWLYIERALDSIFDSGCIGPGKNGTIAALGAPASGANVTAGNSAGAVAHAAAALLPMRTVVYYDGAPALTTFFTTLGTSSNNPSVIYIPSGYATGGLTTAEAAVLNANAAQIVAFVNGGGGLMAHIDDQSGTQTWLTTLLPGLVVTPSSCISSGATLTLDGMNLFGAIIQPTLSTGPCHATFSGNLNGLKVLANDGRAPAAGGPRPFIIGGGCVTIGNVDFTATSVCEGTPTAFTNTSTGATVFSWNFGDATSSTATNPTHTYAAAGTYSVTLQANPPSGPTKTKNVIVNPLPPKPVITGPTTTCESPTSYCVYAAPGVSYTWTVNGGTASSLSGPCIQVTWGTSTSPSLTVEASNGFCRRRETIKIEPCCRTASCCEGLALDASLTSFTNAGGGNYTITQALSASPGKVTKVRATVVSTSITRPTFCGTSGVANSFITGGSPVSGFLAPYLPYPFSREIVWEAAMNPVTVNPASFAFNLNLPPVSGGFFCSDAVTFCVRYDFTVEQPVFGGTTCRTCSVTRCYGPINRYKKIIWDWDTPVIFAGRLIDPGPTVRIFEGEIETDLEEGTLTIEIKPGTGTPGARLLGELTTEVHHGVATFRNLAIDRPGKGYVLVVRGGDLEPAESRAFDVREPPNQ